MRKLRRLPWRIPKSHHGEKQPNIAAAQAAPNDDLEFERERARELEREKQPVAFAGGRYVYGTCAAPVRGTEVRRKTRHRVMPLPLPVLA